MDNPKKQQKAQEQRLQQAGEWLALLRQDDATPEQLTAWLDWCRGDSRNLDAFEQIRDLASGLSSLDADEKSAIIRECLPEHQSEHEPTKPHRRHVIYTLAASITVAAVALGYFVGRESAQNPSFKAVYMTAKAQNRKYSLPDGTRIELGARSKIHIVYTPGSRVVELRSGEAYFKVKHDARRPFVVRTGKLRVQDIGTVFDVRKSGRRIVVAVANGAVDVSHSNDDGDASSAGAAIPPPSAKPVRLTAGHQVHTNTFDSKLSVARINIRAVASWRHGRLKFQNEPLSNVIANINRYSARKIVIADPAVGKMRFTGTVFENRITDWLTATEDVFSLRRKQGEHGRVLLYAKRGS